MTAATITITGTSLNPDDTNDTGTVTFTPINTADLSSDGVLVPQDPVDGKVVNGILKNAANTGPMILVAIAGGYHVTFAMDGATPLVADIRGDIDCNLNTVTWGTLLDASGLNVQTTTVITGTSYTLTQADFAGDQILSFTSAGTAGKIAVTVPLDNTDNTQNPADGSSVILSQDGSGQLVVGGPGAGSTGGTAGGVTLTSPAAYVTTGQYARAEVLRRPGANAYRIYPSGAATAATGFTFKGTWSSATTYATNDVAYYNGTSYVALGGNTNLTPDNHPAQWSPFAGQGASATTTCLFLGQTGTLATGTGLDQVPIPRTMTITSVTARVSTAPAGAAIRVDVNKNGTTIWTTQTNRPSIAIGANSSGRVTNMDVTSLAAGDYLSLDVDVVGIGTLGSYLVVTIELL